MRRILSLFRRKPISAKWETVGSPSYRAAMRQMYGLASSIRRSGWGERRHLWLRFRDIHDGNVRGRYPDDLECHPPGFLILEGRDSRGSGWRDIWYWNTPREEIEADDWEYCLLGEWKRTE